MSDAVDDDDIDLGRRNLRCPCGELIKGDSQDDLVAKAQAHLREAHEGREYSRNEILFMAY